MNTRPQQPALIAASPQRASMHALLLRVCAWFCLTLAVLSAQAAEPYPLRDARFPANEGAGQIIWLDQHQVAFAGYEPGSYSPQGGDRGFKSGMYVWDTRAGRVHEFPNTGRELCYDNGYISYVRPDPQAPEEFLHYAGPLGNEKPVRYIRGRGRNQFSCRYYDAYPGWLPPDRTARPLHDDHGYLDMGLPRGEGWSLENAPVTFFRRGSNTGVRLPFGQRQINTIRYSSFNKSYLLYGGYVDKGGVDSTWPQGMPQPVWVLNVDGGVEEFRVPSGPWNSAGSTMYYLTRNGVFIVSHNFATLSDAGPAGAYLFDGKAVRKIITGALNGTAVSPDGCKVAFVYARSTVDRVNGFNAMQHGGPPTQTARMIDLCGGGAR